MIKNIISSSRQRKYHMEQQQQQKVPVIEITCEKTCDKNQLMKKSSATRASFNGTSNHLLASMNSCDTMSNASGKSHTSNISSRLKLGRKSTKKKLNAMMDRLHLRKNRSSPSGLSEQGSRLVDANNAFGRRNLNGSIDDESIYTEEDSSHDEAAANQRLSNQSIDENSLNSDSEYELASEDLFEDASNVAQKSAQPNLESDGSKLAQLKQQQSSNSAETSHFKPSKDNVLLPEEQCDIPTFLHTKPCDSTLIEQTRKLLKERYLKNPDSFYDEDYQRMLNDDWTVSRFLLRRRLDPKRTAKLMEECGRFRIQYKMSEVQLWEFPREFHLAGGLFKYAPDRVGNVTMYMRVKMYRRVPEISDVFKAFILCVLEECDRANGGRGTAIIFDLSGCGLQNVDLGFLSWLLSSFRNYCPKGVSYIIVYNLPWILNATCKMAMTWMSASNRRALRFVHGDEIENFIARENLPDYLGGTCKIDYKHVPEGSRPAIEVCDRLDMTREQALKIKELFKEYLTSDGGDDDNDDADNDNNGNHEANCTSSAKSTSVSSQSCPTKPTQTFMNNNYKGAVDDSTSNKFLSLDNISEDVIEIVHDATSATAATTAAAELVSRASKFIA